jgi:prophage antirepressor-like protein
MAEEFKEDNNCIVKAFENNPIAILQEDVNSKKVYWFKASDIGKALNLVNIRTSIMNYDEDERTVRTTYSSSGGNPETIYLSSQGVYRLLYNSKKEVAKKFRKWAGNILDDIIFNESAELKKQLKEKDKLIQQLENKPDTEGFHQNPGYIYLVKDTSKLGHYKIGFASDPQKRISQLNTASSTYSLEIVCRVETYDKEFAEIVIHRALQPFRIKGRKDESTRFDSSAWFYLKNDFELAYSIKVIKECIIYIKKYNIENYDNFKELKLDVEKELEEINKDNNLKQEIKEENSKKCKLNGQQMSNKSGNYKGVCWEETKQKWSCKLKKDYKTHFLGYFDSELDAAKSYNDYAVYINQTEESIYALNDIEDYVPVPRDIPTETKVKILENVTSKYQGVSYDSTRKYYVVSIKYNKKSYSLGNNGNELECAKIYNQQALYFNENNNTNYVLNDIPDYITIPKDIYQEIQDKKMESKSSKYHGVTLSKKNGKYRAVLVHNKKQIHIGFFENELDAAEAYNKQANELNEKNEKLIYKINK